jgi:hypothetical protein
MYQKQPLKNMYVFHIWDLYLVVGVDIPQGLLLANLIRILFKEEYCFLEVGEFQLKFVEYELVYSTGLRFINLYYPTFLF